VVISLKYLLSISLLFILPPHLPSKNVSYPVLASVLR